MSSIFTWNFQYLLLQISEIAIHSWLITQQYTCIMCIEVFSCSSLWTLIHSYPQMGIVAFLISFKFSRSGYCDLEGQVYILLYFALTFTISEIIKHFQGHVTLSTFRIMWLRNLSNFQYSKYILCKICSISQSSYTRSGGSWRARQVGNQNIILCI